ncbi:alpha carbonic anhydrase 7-like [Lotus japonicus]|uniref:alpha carbonic anhydrase 7-like n=1 Tax=Lotus japonicus TaxID=34305 RepID=UPI0025910700|nr:alpha carbonic anhydrase 7-like [Lotus japonicus]
MNHQSRLIVFLPNLLIMLIILLHPKIWTVAQEVGNEREFNYIKGSEKGPSNLGKLKKEWETCKTGRMQSPTDLSSHRVRVVPKLGELKKFYKPQNATVKNRGHDIEMKWEAEVGSITLCVHDNSPDHRSPYSPPSSTLLQVLATMNELQKMQLRYELELHMVHEGPKVNGKSKIAVVGLLYKIGRPDPILNKLSKYIKSMGNDDEAERSIGVMDPSKIKLGGKKYYSYIGSLTVPPCTKGVIWTINKRIRSVTKAQIKLLREAVHDHAKRNARPVQSLNRRGIQLYGPKRKE